MRGLFLLVAALATIAVAPSAAVAGGGGGAKKNAWINVTNNSSVQVGAIIDVDPSVGPLTTAQFLSRGGVVLPIGKPGKFHVVAGSHTVYVVYLDNVGNPTALVAKPYSVGKGGTLEVHATDAGLSP